VSETSVARVYATALFAAAGDAGEADAVSAQFGDLAAAMTSSAALSGALEDPQVRAAQKTGIVADLTANDHALVRNAALVMLDKGRIVLVPEVSRQFDRLAADAARLIDVEVTSAQPLDAETESGLVRRIEDALGRRVRLSKIVDTGVIGGLVVRVGDVVLDASLRARVDQLRERIKRGETRGDA
jgi:F-type H+-transporting ATPase subunit delta